MSETMQDQLVAFLGTVAGIKATEQLLEDSDCSDLVRAAVKDWIAHERRLQSCDRVPDTET